MRHGRSLPLIELCSCAGLVLTEINCLFAGLEPEVVRLSPLTREQGAEILMQMPGLEIQQHQALTIAENQACNPQVC